MNFSNCNNTKLLKVLILNIIPVLIGMIFFYIAQEIFNYVFPVVEGYVYDPAIVGLFMIIFPFAIFLVLVLFQFLFITKSVFKKFRRILRVLMSIVMFIAVMFFLISFVEMYNFQVALRVFSEVLFESSAYVIANLLTSKFIFKLLKAEEYYG